MNPPTPSEILDPISNPETNYKFDELGDGEDTTMFVSEGHDVPLSAFDEFIDGSYGALSADRPTLTSGPRNVFAVWEDVGPTEDGEEQRFAICPQETEGATPYTVCDVVQS